MLNWCSKDCTPDERKAIALWLGPAFERNANTLADSIGNAIKSFRGQESQESVAMRIRDEFGSDISAASLSQTESGNAPSSWQRMAMIAHTLRISLGDLFVGSGQMSPHISLNMARLISNLKNPDFRAQLSPAQMHDLREIAAMGSRQRKKEIDTVLCNDSLPSDPADATTSRFPGAEPRGQLLHADAAKVFTMTA